MNISIKIQFLYLTKHWKTNDKGVLVINESQKKEWLNRLNKLRLYIKYYINHVPKEQITIESLYFNKKQIKPYNPKDFE
jgi:hypothetical protein